jgi:hypothetical protein
MRQFHLFFQELLQERKRAKIISRVVMAISDVIIITIPTSDVINPITMTGTLLMKRQNEQTTFSSSLIKTSPPSL